METITISVRVLKELIKIADDYLEDGYASELSKSYFIGKRDAYKNILTTYTNEEWDNN
jgi:ATP-dependent Lon protease